MGRDSRIWGTIYRSNPDFPVQMREPFRGKNYFCTDSLAVVVIDLKTRKVEPLIVLPKQRGDIELSLPPDGLALLFDRVSIKQTLPANDALTTSTGSAIASSHLWLLPLEEKTSESVNSTL